VGYHPRIESKDIASFLTSRTVQSRLWFVNNAAFQSAILSFAAKYSNRYGAKLYALAIEGNHTQGPALFPNENRSSYMRDLNSSIARAIPKYTNHLGGRLWGRRYSNEFLPGKEDIEEYFFYTVLQPVKDGLVPKISEYPGYNCFHDAVWGRVRKYKVVKWGEYNARLKRDPSARIADYTEVVELRYERLPGYEHLSQKEYAHLMMRKLEERRQVILQDRAARGLGFVGRENLLKVIPGSLPRNTKTSSIDDHRPRVLSICPVRRADCKDWYFDIFFRYRACSAEYRTGNTNVVFPLGTYPPHLPCNFKLAA
jgi:hypothetical protein